jgi:hypothetical protein
VTIQVLSANTSHLHSFNSSRTNGINGAITSSQAIVERRRMRGNSSGKHTPRTETYVLCGRRANVSFLLLGFVRTSHSPELSKPRTGVCTMPDFRMTLSPSLVPQRVSFLCFIRFDGLPRRPFGEPQSFVKWSVHQHVGTRLGRLGPTYRISTLILCAYSCFFPARLMTSLQSRRQLRWEPSLNQPHSYHLTHSEIPFTAVSSFSLSFLRSPKNDTIDVLSLIGTLLDHLFGAPFDNVDEPRVTKPQNYDRFLPRPAPRYPFTRRTPPASSEVSYFYGVGTHTTHRAVLNSL